MRTRKKQFVCPQCNQSIALAHPTCQACDKPMDAAGDKFLDYIGIHQLRRSHRWTEESLYYVFDLSVGVFYINGCTYNASKRCLMLPSFLRRGRKVRPVRAFGATIKPIRKMVIHAILEMEGWKPKQKEPQPDTQAAA